MKRGTAGYALYSALFDERIQYHEILVCSDTVIKCLNPGCRCNITPRKIGNSVMAWALFIRAEGDKTPKMRGYLCPKCMGAVRGKENIKQVSFEGLTGIDENSAEVAKSKRKGKING